MQPTRSSVFIRHLVEAATARPMLNLLLEMKQARVAHITTRMVAHEPPAPEQSTAFRQPNAA